MNKDKLRKIVESNKTFAYSIQVLILLSVMSYSVETLPDLDASTMIILERIEIFCVVVFTFEYILRVYVAKKPLNYAISFYGIVDLISILPFYFSHAMDLRAVRVLRIFRLFRLLKLVRYNKALNRFKLAAQIVKEEMVLFLILTFIVIYLSACGIYFFENEAQPEIFSSVFHSLWWAIATLTTVGYGDIYPVTTGGKIFTFLILIVGIGIVTVPAGMIATALSKARLLEKTD